MKILFTGYHNPHFVTITEYIENAIKKLGHELLSFDNREFIIPGRIRERIPFLQEVDLKRINHNLIRLIDSFQPELFLETGGHRIFPETIKRIRKRGIKTILWTIDHPRNFQLIIEAAPYYDFVFCGGTEAMEILKDNGISKCRWLPFACNPEFHKPVNLTEDDKDRYGNDICFVGSMYPERAHIFETLTEFDIGIWGPGWDTLPQDSPIKRLVRASHIKPGEWIKIYSASGIALAIHYKDPENKVPCHQASPRVYEVLACGSLLIVDSQKDVLSIFVPGEDLLVFKDTNDLKRLLPYYLEHKDEARRIAKRGREKVLNHHTYKHRVEEILRIVSG